MAGRHACAIWVWALDLSASPRSPRDCTHVCGWGPGAIDPPKIPAPLQFKYIELYTQEVYSSGGTTSDKVYHKKLRERMTLFIQYKNSTSIPADRHMLLLLLLLLLRITAVLRVPGVLSP